MPRDEEGNSPLDQVMALLPAEIRESWANFRESWANFTAIERQRQAIFDAMELPALKEFAEASLGATTSALRRAALTRSLKEHGWTEMETERLASYFEELGRNIDEAGPCGTINMSKWFDDVGITLEEQDELKEACHDAATVYNAYVRRKWPR